MLKCSYSAADDLSVPSLCMITVIIVVAFKLRDFSA